MRSVSKIISCVLALSILFTFFAFPVSASAATNYEIASSMFDALVEDDSGMDTFLDQFLIEDFNSCSGCSNSPDGYHFWEYSNYLPIYPGVGIYRCAYCKMSYSDYCSNAYESYCSDLPSTVVDNSGALTVYGTHLYSRFYNYSNGKCCYCPHSPYSSTLIPDSVVHPCSGSFSYSHSVNLYLECYYELICPVTGYYTQIASPSFSYTYITSDLITRSINKSYSKKSSTYYSSGSSITCYFNSVIYSQCISGTAYPPKYSVLPSDTTTTNYYVNASRPTYNITYDLATVNNYGDYTVINNVYENQTIINEGDNIYTDIETGNEYEIEGWEFDYTSRTYHLTLDNGDLVDVTFGDKYVTVELNGEVEYYYYATEDDSAAGCSHDYDLAESVAATCTEDGYNVYVCTLCNHSYQDQTFAIGHNYQFLWTVLDTYEVDTSTLVCPGCNGTDITCTQVDKTENFTCVCNSADCAQTWTVVGSTIAGYDLYQCINCQEFYNDYTHEGVDRSDAGYWSWLQTWLQNFKTWLGEKLDALINKEVAVGGDTINNEEVNNFYDQSDTNINTDADIDYAISYTDEDGTEQETSLKGIIAKFAFIKDIWKIGQTLISVVSEDAAYAYEFDPTIGNEATTDTGEEVAAASVTEEADTLLSSGSGAPSIPLNLGAAQSVYGFNYGGEIEMLDLSWYTPYKETVDKLVGGFLWLFFMWKLFQRAPDIISGAGMDSYKQEDLSAGNKLSRRRVKTNWRSRP